jgi:prepilin-type processing-associated H-X9-DG protein
MKEQTTHQKYHELILTAETSGVMKLHVRELNNILYIDGHVPSEKVKQDLWELYNKIDPGYRSGDLVLNLQLYQQAGLTRDG